MIPIARPQMGEEEKERSLGGDGLRIARAGPEGRELEERFAAFVGVAHAVATSSGTTALHLALLGHGIGPGDEVITVPFTFIASANSIVYTGARPVFVDVDDATSRSMSARSRRRSRRGRARSCRSASTASRPTCRRSPRSRSGAALAIVEDAAQAHGAAIGERRSGTLGRGHLQLLPDQEHDHRRGRHDHDRRRRAGRTRSAAARARDAGPLPPRRHRLQLPHDRSRRGHRPGPAAEAGRLQRPATRDRGSIRRRAARCHDARGASGRHPRLPPVHDPGARARRLRRSAARARRRERGLLPDPGPPPEAVPRARLRRASDTR